MNAEEKPLGQLSMVPNRAQPRRIFRFAQSALRPDTGELIVHGKTVLLGRRPLALLLTFLEARGDLVTKERIFEKVWPGIIVEENTLQGQVSALRKALGPDGEYLQTLSGRGYRFTAPVIEMSGDDSVSESTNPDLSRPRTPIPVKLPVAASALIDRDQDIASVSTLIAENRLVVLTGPGGIGKTRLALEVAKGAGRSSQDGIFLVELALVSDPELVAPLVATALELNLSSGAESAERVARAIGNRAILVVLDSCEHVIDAAASVAEAILKWSPCARVLATTREPLRAEGEHLYVVSGLEVPPEGTTDIPSILRMSGVQLFLDRASAAGARLPLEQRVLAPVAEVCRRLDGIPLALELAATRAAALGVEEVAQRLDARLTLLCAGRRTALPRHQTLRATLDWSHELLTATERMVFRRLGVFAGPFPLEAATKIASEEHLTEPELIRVVGDLVAKSLLVPETMGQISTYRLLETTRSYALEILKDSAEFDFVSRRHALYCIAVMQRAEARLYDCTVAEWVRVYAPHLHELRSALGWAYSDSGDASAAVDLTIAAIPLWVLMCLAKEASVRIEQALSLPLMEANPTTRRHMKLFAALGVLSTFGQQPRAITHLELALSIAERLEDWDYCLRALAGLFSLCGATGELSRAPALAQHFQRIASLSKDPFDALVAERMMGTALFGLNDLAAAQAHLTKAATFGAAHRCAAHILRYQFDISVSNRVTLAHVLWLRGLADQAISVMHTNLEAARGTDHPTSLFSAIGASGCPISLATGNLPMAQRMIDELIELASRHLVDQYRNAAYCFLGALLVKQGDPAAGLQLLNSSKPTMLDYTFLPIYYLPVSAMIAEALGLCGRVEEGLAEIEECLQPSNIRGRTWNVPELHRLRGELLLRDSAMVDLEGAEKAFKRAIQQANHQGLLSFELRASTSLARLHLREGRKDEAGTLLGSVCSRFSEGYQTADFQEAQRLLSLLASSGST